jgi:hypothetical protein
MAVDFLGVVITLWLDKEMPLFSKGAFLGI